MKVNYKIIEYRPEREWISVEFTHPDRPNEPWTRQFHFPDFGREKLIEQLQAMASGIAGSWTRIPDHPGELTIPTPGSSMSSQSCICLMSQTLNMNLSPIGMNGRRIYCPAKSHPQRSRQSRG